MSRGLRSQSARLFSPRILLLGVPLRRLLRLRPHGIILRHGWQRVEPASAPGSAALRA